MRAFLPRYALLIVMSVVTPATAGIVDTPLPLLKGQKALHVFTVPGVTHENGIGLGTVFMCASTERTKPVTIAVEIFDHGGGLLNDTSVDGSVVLQPASTLTLETRLSGSSVIAFLEDGHVVLTGASDHGTARILATSKNIVCTALIASLAGSPPTVMASLPVIAKAKQRGD
jgi:hypothetical protein